MEVHEPQPLSNWRLAPFGLIGMIGLALLAVRLYHLQVVQSEAFEQRQVRQSVRRVLLPSPRGRILDRHGRLLADNRPNYCLAVYVEELRRPGRWSNTVNVVEQELDRIAPVLQLPRTLSRARIEDHIHYRLPLPLPAWEHLDDTAVARLIECRRQFPGVDIFVQPDRVYPLGRLAAHVLGYAGRGEYDAMARAEDFHYHLPGLKGRSGLEKEYDDLLCGIPGGQLIRVDASGYRHDEWIMRQPVRGRDLTLTLDAAIQAALENALQGVRGAGVVLDPRNGEILAMASAPTFDPGALSPAPSVAQWNALRDDPDHPLVNRAIAGRYPPGSTFKPFVALAAQTQSGKPPATTYVCEGTFQVGTRTIHCAFGEKHGAVDMRKAIEVSCNAYFSSLALDIGYDPIWTVAQQAGLGRRTGVDLPGETDGLLPSGEWKRQRLREEWTPGDTCNVAIGQGLLLVSPLQMAVATATLANGGRVLRPRLLRTRVPDDTHAPAESAGRAAEVPFLPGDAATPPDASDMPDPYAPAGGCVVSRANWPAAAVKLVRDGMTDVVSGDEGTGRRARIAGIRVAAKTGTAEYREEGVPKKYGWMISFAPVEAPRAVVVMVVEEAQTGGLTVGPRLQRVLLAIFADEIAAGERGGGA